MGAELAAFAAMGTKAGQAGSCRQALEHPEAVLARPGTAGLARIISREGQRCRDRPARQVSRRDHGFDCFKIRKGDQGFSTRATW